MRRWSRPSVRARQGREGGSAKSRPTLSYLFESYWAKIICLIKKTSTEDLAAKGASGTLARAETTEKENAALKQTLKYLQAVLVKAGNKVQH